MSDPRWTDVDKDIDDALRHFGMAVRIFDEAQFDAPDLEGYKSSGAFPDLPHASPVGPETGERQQRSRLVRREPDRRLLAIDQIVFRKRRERYQAAVIRPEPSLPVGARHVADVGDRAVRPAYPWPRASGPIGAG
jgi:hypothetical protein